MPLTSTLRSMRPAARAYLLGSAFMGGTQAVTWTFLARWLNGLGHTKTEIGTFQSLDSWGKVAVALPAAFVLARLSRRVPLARPPRRRQLPAGRYPRARHARGHCGR